MDHAGHAGRVDREAGGAGVAVESLQVEVADPGPGMALAAHVARVATSLADLVGRGSRKEAVGDRAGVHVVRMVAHPAPGTVRKVDPAF